MNSTALAFRFLQRDWRSGELSLLAIALVLAVSTVAGIGLFVDRLQGALLAQSSEMLAADRVIASAEPTPDAWRAQAEALGLRTSATLGFTSMVFVRDTSQLVSVKAVDAHYPLRGVLIVADQPFVRGTPTRSGPARGEVWVDSRLVPALGIRLGDTVTVGVAQFTVRRVVISEPDRSGGFFALGPRLLMNVADVPRTQVVQPGSRVSYRLLLAGNESTLAQLQTALAPDLNARFRWQSVKDDSPMVGAALTKAQSFLLLGGLLGVLLSGIAVALAAHRYSARHFDHVAVLKTLGVGPAGIRSLYFRMLAMIGVSAISAGCVLGYGVHEAILVVLDRLVTVALPAPSFSPFLLAAGTGGICLAAFAVPPMLMLQSVSPMRVIRGDTAGDPRSLRLAYGAGALGLLALLLWYSRSLLLTGMILLGGIVIVASVLLVAWLMLRTTRAVGMQAGSAWRLAMAALRRRGLQNAVQIMVFSLAIMLLLVLTLVRTALLDDWRKQLPADAPNHFVMNILPEEVAPVQLMLRAETGVTLPLFPLIRGRLTSVNGVPLADWTAKHRDESAPAPPADNDRNLTFSNVLPGGNRIVAGSWWAADEQSDLVSLDEGMARSAGVKIGDQLRFSIVDRDIDVRVASLRKVDWDSMRPNFFMVFTPHVIKDLPATYLTSFYLAPTRKVFLNKFLVRFPTVSVLEVDALIDQVRSIVERVTAAIELVLGLVLVAGALVLVAAVLSSLDERVREHALLRTLGGSRRLISTALAAEFTTLGACAGLLAAVGAELSVYELETRVFELTSTLHPLLFIVGPLVGVVIIGAVGLIATRRVLTTPPVIVLRGS